MLSYLLSFIGIIVVLTLVLTSLYMGFVAARSNGWRELAEPYRYRGKAPSTRLRFQSATLNEYSFPGTMQVAATEHGLWMKAMFLLYHPPLLIPWGELDPTRLEGRFDSGVRLKATPGTRLDLALSESTRAGLLKNIDASWSEARATLLAEIAIQKKL